MSFLIDSALDAAIEHVTDNCDKIVICSQEPTTYAEANSTYKLGYKNSPSFAAPSNRSPSGRESVLSAFTDGVVDGSGTATHFALLDTTTSRLLATGALSSSQAVTSGNSWSIPNTAILGIPDPA